MVLDECIETPAPRDKAEAALVRTTSWAKRARDIFRWRNEAYYRPNDRNGNSESCRAPRFRICAAKARGNFWSWIFPDTPSVGSRSANRTDVTCEMAAEVTALLPDDRPRYLMGVGRPEQLADYVALGIDMMDCVLPTRAARHACLYTSEGRVLIKNARYIEDQRPIDPQCSCRVCRRYTRAYLRHLFAAGEITAAILATHHNVHFYLDIMRQIREAIGFGNLAKFAAEMQARYVCRSGPSLNGTRHLAGFVATRFW